MEINIVGTSLSFITELDNTPENISAGKTRFFKDNWRQITNDKWILQTISGNRVELDSVPEQMSVPKPSWFKPPVF